MASPLREVSSPSSQSTRVDSSSSSNFDGIPLCFSYLFSCVKTHVRLNSTYHHFHHERRRLKINRNFAIRNLFGPTPFDNLFQSLITQYPSVNSLDLVTPALGFASGVALYLSRYKARKDSGLSDIGEWILFASPTPFNRFVLFRCPSISIQGSE